MSKRKRPSPPVQDENYSTKKWHGLPMFACSRCQWSTMSEVEIIKHVAKHLSSEVPKTQTVKTGLVGPSGGDIVRTVEIDAGPEEGDTHGE